MTTLPPQHVSAATFSSQTEFLNSRRLLSFHHQNSTLPTSSPNRKLLTSPLKISSRYATALAASPYDLSPPPIDHDLLETAATAGAKVSDYGIIETFNNDDEALDAAHNGVVVVDLSHFGRIRVSGEDRIQFLHNQSTANFECLHDGQGCDTVFVTPTARTIDIAHAWIMKNAITLVVSPVTCRSIIDVLNKLDCSPWICEIEKLVTTSDHYKRW